MVLIVDDIKANIIALKKTLELHDIDVDTAESGEEALKKILKTNYCLIIMDVQMPGLDGFEVVKILSGNKRTKDIPVIFLSALNIEKKYIFKGYETGAVEYITKPVDTDLLMLKVKTFLKIYEQQNELKLTKELLSKEIKIRKEAQDNLEIKIAERTKELVLKNEELEMKNHELQQFAWVVSHDLNEPIRKIQIFIKIIKELYLKEDDKGIDYVNRTIKSAERMQTLITDLLAYSRLSAQVKPEVTDLNIVLQEVLSDFDYLIERKNATVKTTELPTIDSIPSQLRQVFQNLIGNALKFSGANEPPFIEITSELIVDKSFDSPTSPEGKYCRIIVKDNGIGFDEIYLDRIFIIFQSLNDRQTYEGTGIGLAIAKKIIEKHNGLITARSEVGKGASFIIILPLKYEK
ncbi:hybrid sensor histidine kinase/response regulator [Flavobacterium johnsoniae]|jgi:signal transduction histidine kinase|uniref:histidine kinase n=1 Tax=Flavobacterium johnsoniae (strain ATCC 17061 / DSM 2064 / JCM 8514 / BCRC 14874 / CCUG 350202 / NBRC 14942 / NCIMB 11054 / UW101) TaxID=376686 RepID=A5FEK5_FLAJ1|nr:response regulator [Flavobacterium johnsoniae]ABQ06369.1 response regulator receiver sensor/signal transduction histidine kinase [Flavobacterium johnsoniae UW101]OXE95373.1 hybrid sensor histidine kinase/response regulator [Flavobacterium johnsoniae UW101]WQG82118.1 response regulator [Flavobacterium johnsoniae UW101]SHK73212.1 His Kinase A (phospho-acceptor) domain-containing protein [Flavobacterium johnsoniae]